MEDTWPCRFLTKKLKDMWGDWKPAQTSNLLLKDKVEKGHYTTRREMVLGKWWGIKQV